MRLNRFVSITLLFVSARVLSAQRDSLALTGLRWREIGPYRGGRSVAGTGNPSRPDEFWMGTTGGGVFKSINAGQSWAPVTDRYFGGTIGAIAVAPSAPDVVYVGGGEYPIRGNVSHGRIRKLPATPDKVRAAIQAKIAVAGASGNIHD